METVPLTLAIVVMQILGLPGLIFIIWHFDNKRSQRQEKKRDKELDVILTQYRDDVSEIKRLYESNVRLVKDFSGAYKQLLQVYGETMSVISLNSQNMTHLADAIKNNQFCPEARKAVNG